MFESNRIKIWPIFHLCCTRPSICISVLIYLTRSYWALGFILYSPWIFCCCRQPCDSSICSEKSVSSFTKKSFDRKVGEMCAFLLVPVPWKIHPINQHFPRLPCQTRMKKKSDHLDEVHGKYFLSKAYTTWKIYFVASANRMNLLPSWSERNLSHFYLRCLVSALKNCHRLKPFAVRRVIEVFDITCQ